MDKTTIRLVEPSEPPTPEQVESWIGRKAHSFWTSVSNMIVQNYPDTFVPEWLFGGKKHGWSLRYKKNKSFCTFIPERNRFTLLIVFGVKECDKVEKIRDLISEETLKEYDKAETYHDGKWLFLTVKSNAVVNDVERLLSVKRKPKVQAPQAVAEPN